METVSLQRLLADLQRPSVMIELAVLAVCLLAAYGIARLLGRHRSQESVWIGKRVFDGLLFPLLALVLVYAAQFAVAAWQPVALLRLAVPILSSLAVIRLVARVLTVAFPASRIARLVERLISWVAWAVAILWVVGLLPPVLAQMDAIQFSFGKSRVSLRSLAEGSVSSALVLLLALWLSAVVEKRVLRASVTDLSIRKILVNMIRSLLLLAALLFTLSAIGIDLTALSVLGGAFGVGLGLGFQKLAANYVSGFVILLERRLRIGDSVRVDNFEGTITDITARYTVIRAANGRESIVPNETLVITRVENLTRYEAKFGMTTDITVNYGCDPQAVIAVLSAAALAQPRVLKDPAPAAYLVGFVTEGLAFSLNYWIADPGNGQANVRSAIHLAMLAGLRSVGAVARPAAVALAPDAAPDAPPSGLGEPAH